MHDARQTRYQRSIAIRVTAAFLERVRLLAATQEQRVSELCRDAIREYVARLERAEVAHDRAVHPLSTRRGRGPAD